MDELWQNAIVLAVVAVAAFYLVVRSVRVFRRKQAAGCGSGCGGCGSKTESKPRLVSIGLEDARVPRAERDRPI